jgi:methyltransferase (TIGR00027 family)
MKGVAATALWIAAKRALETERDHGLFEDPFARSLAGDVGFRVLAEMEDGTAIRPPVLEVRTRFLDDRAMAYGESGIRQVVLLAAGMDARAYRLPWPEGTTLYEIDQPHVLAYKEEKIGSAKPTCDRREVRADLVHDDWRASLVDRGFERKTPTLWFVEGLLMYLQEQEARALLTAIDGMSAAKSVVLFDIPGRSVLESPFVKPMLDNVARLGAPWTFGTDEPESLLAPLAWDVSVHETAIVGNQFGRWPYPAVPRGTPGMPQSFFVEATKR